jgi:hypothetical protein
MSDAAIHGFSYPSSLRFFGVTNLFTNELNGPDSENAQNSLKPTKQTRQNLQKRKTN